MVMASTLLRQSLRDASGARARLLDAALDLADGDYPPVVRWIYEQPRGKRQALPFGAVRADWTRPGDLRVDALGDGTPVSDDELARAVLLGRDVLDALVLDTTARQALRANDLWLEERAGRLCLTAADAGPLAVLRRFARGLLPEGAGRRLIDWCGVEFLRGDPAAARAGRDYHRRVAELPPAIIARLVDGLPYLHAAELLTLLPDAKAADVLEVMGAERQLQVFEELEAGQGNRLLARMAPDAAADLLARLPMAATQEQLERLPAAQRGRVLALLRFPEDTAGGIMTNDVVVAPADLTAGEARGTLAEQLRAPDFVYYVFVVDSLAERRLRGVLTLRDLLLADAAAPLEELMQAHPYAVDPLEAADTAARRLADTQFLALPVVGRDEQFLGAITIDAAMARLAPPSWRDQAPKVFS